MANPGLGTVEVLLMSLIALACGLVFPIGVIYFLFTINKKVNNIEEMLKKNKEE